MKKIRYGSFETNSSSTHTITISKYQKPREENIPRNLTKITGEMFNIAEYGDCGGDDETYACDTIRTEVEKLGFIINMIASICQNKYEDMWDFNKRDIKGYNEEIFQKLIKTDLFTWLKESVFEETGTMINYVMPEGYLFPFYETTYDENRGISSILSTESKDEFKKKVKEIIFDKDVIIENEVCPYGMER